jgi:hypothetical protein
MSGHDYLVAMLNWLKLTALRTQLDNLIDEAGRRELTIRDALPLFCEREIGRRDQRRIDMSYGLAHFPFVRDLTSFDFVAQPSIDKASARRIWPWRSDARRSWPATPCCSPRRRRWWRGWPTRKSMADWKNI